MFSPDASPPPDASDASFPPDAPNDRDGDGVPDSVDLCPDHPDPAQHDLDGDGLGDACDDDDDGDGIPDVLDLCPTEDSRGEPDEDGDGIRDSCDACPLDADPTQANADGDRLGDACEDPDPTRFSHVAYLNTFASGRGDLLGPNNGVNVADGSLSVRTGGPIVLFRPEDPNFPSDYAVDVRGRYLEPIGFFPSGSFGLALRWSNTDKGTFGVALGARTASRALGVRLYKGNGCFGPCTEDLRWTEATVPRGSDFALRGTAAGADFDVRLRIGATTVALEASVPEPTSGGIGVIVDQAHVRFHALAVYAP